MSKNIIIQEGGTGKQMTVNKLKTDLVGGGTALWVLESETTLVTKHVTENGTYIAANEQNSPYGYSQVTVSVPGGNGSANADGTPSTSGGTTPGGAGSSVIGVNTGGVQWPSADDQNEYAVGVNESGDLVVTPVPSGIEIVTEPTKKTYTSGETIDYTGIVVKLKSKDGGDFTNSDYSNGKIPMNELIFTVNTASGSVNPDPDGQIHTGSYYVSDGSAVAICTQSDGSGGNLVVPAGVTFCGIKKINDINFYVVAIGDSPFTLYSYRQNDGSLEYTKDANLVNFDGVSKYVAINYWYDPAPTPVIAYNQPSPTDTRSIQFIAYDIMCGDGSTQVIPVGWKSPYDDRQFVDGFNITVMRSSSGNGSGTESGGSNTGGSGGFGGNDDDFSGSGGSF